MNNASFTIQEILKITSGKLISSSKEHQNISEILIDSRQLGKTNEVLFVAIKTERNNGHNYISELVEKGVRNFLISSIDFITLIKATSEKTNFSDCNLLLVNDTIIALQQLALYYRKTLNYPIIGITGSNGKTIVKEWLWQLLSPQLKISRSPKSYNSQIGVPLSILKMEKDSNLGIIEAGISRHHEMEKLSSVIAPDIGILTNIGQAHSENFENKKDIIKEKIQLFQDSKQIIFRADDDELLQMIERCYPDKLLITWKMKDVLKFLKDVKLPSEFKNEASIENIGHCIAALKTLGYDPNDFKKQIASLTPVEMRLEIKKGVNNCLILNDSYSLDINSFAIAIDTLVQQNRYEKKTIIISDFAPIEDEMIEYQAYLQIAEIINNKPIDRAILIGETLKTYRYLFNKEINIFKSTKDFLKKINSLRFSNEAILIKGARNFQLENLSNVLQQQEHETVLEVNMETIKHNLNKFKEKLSPQTKILTIVKAFSYGAGSIEIADLMQANNVDYIAVAFVDEGIQLRDAGITHPIIVMNPESNALRPMIAYNLEPEVYSFRRFEQICTELNNNNADKLPYNIHLKIDTGMHRLGFSEDEIDELIKKIDENKNLIKVSSIFSHLACSDDPAKDDFTKEQIALFKRLADKIERAIGYQTIKHILNSSGIARFPEAQMDMVRLGIGLYGADERLREILNLEQALKLKTIISQIKTIEKGERIGYGMEWEAKKKTKLAILPIGYADGLKLSLANKAEVDISGKRYPIVGRISMDMCYVDITGKNIVEGEEVEIFGNNISIDELAKSADTISYEIISTLSQRIKRVYFY
ncbi:bifunctional UDP-N-acetylmuramoyl-tripeptide:D-alanyl-D-alanine ligase/alanine racemase [Bacteroidales bacterium OttesenSCG-928-K22]|nr:bifunctional UDP-N-acetylmuramoyl-tripeptide:D-alanyl-D-alanine ligase/alanine racemase [Bacteroidales bacterium OttesenSCG-928-L14]MDL2240910.1 bifunctional UDP-N-acetylmuramoyl-tripeptide:D-alanyl-D-alanine ligase/alanine racemase [Bacteroidales bacterium OttesenSCG-928-K22]